MIPIVTDGYLSRQRVRRPSHQGTATIRSTRDPQYLSLLGQLLEVSSRIQVKKGELVAGRQLLSEAVLQLAKAVAIDSVRRVDEQFAMESGKLRLNELEAEIAANSANEKNRRTRGNDATISFANYRRTLETPTQATSGFSNRRREPPPRPCRFLIGYSASDSFRLIRCFGLI